MKLTFYFLNNCKISSEKSEDRLSPIRAVTSMVLATGRKTLMNQSSKVPLKNQPDLEQEYLAFGGPLSIQPW